MKQQPQPITILGGMGPQASAHLYKLLIQKSQKHPKQKPGIFPHIVLRSLAVEDFISDQAKQRDAKTAMLHAARLADKDNSCVLAIACNTAHVFADDIKEHSKTPFISMIELVANKAAERSKTIGLLATPTTIRTGLYHNALARRGVKCIEPSSDEQETLEQIIRAVIASKAGALEQETLLRIARRMQRSGAESIILGCTELPLVFPKSQAKMTVHDSLEILADHLLQKYYE